MLDKAARKELKELKELNAILSKALAFDKKGMLEEAARSYRFFLSKRKEAVAHYNYAIVLKKLRAYDEAILHYGHAIALQPDYAEAYVNIGNIHQDRQEYEQALPYYDQAILANPRLAAAYYNRGVVLQELRRHEAALADYDQALALQPGFYLAHLNKSVILYELKRKAEAALNYQQILRNDPENIDANWNLGILKLSEGDFAEGWRRSEARLKLHAQIAPGPLWRGEGEIRGKTILVKWEQGFGDTIQFCRYAKLLRQRGANVVLSVQSPLRRLISSLDAEIAVIGEHDMPAAYDHACFLMSLPSILGATLETIPSPQRYLRADPAGAAAWRTRLAGSSGRKIGLVWAGGERPTITCARRNDANRSLQLDRLAPLLAKPGTTFFSLQKGPAAAQLQARHGVTDWTDELHDFADTGALIENLDLVITVDTAVAHLAAALGKPAWIMVPYVSCWRWLESRTDSPWYESVRLFRQAERNDWHTVIEEITEELNKDFFF